MHLIEKEGGTLEYVLDDNDSNEDKEFHNIIQDYKITRLGAKIFIKSKNDNKLVASFLPCDNTQFIYDITGYSIAAKLGTKRFPVANARLELEEKMAGSVHAIKFDRDLSFPLDTLHILSDGSVIPFKVVTLAELLKRNNKNTEKLYNDIAELFNRCSDFTPGKQDEYLKGGKKEDKFCRFNLDNLKFFLGTATDHIFLLDEKDNTKIVGTISALISINENGIVDVYFYDEVVDYFTKLKPQDLLELENLYLDQRLSENSKKSAIANIIEPARLELMKPLFSAARNKINKTILNVQSSWSEQDLNEGINKGMIRAFIRAAEGRVSTYEALNCSKKNVDNYVIHGPRTPYAVLLDTHIKNWASHKLKEVILPSQKDASSQQNKYLKYRKWLGLSIAATLGGVGLFTYKSQRNAAALNVAAATIKPQI